MHKEGKIWGDNILLFKNDSIQINLIDIKKGGRCSKHFHQYKNNIFFVKSGELLIETWQENGLVDTTTLKNEQSTEIPKLVPHRFTALTDTLCIEIYYQSKIEENDIIREDQGTIL